ncbi:MAG: hypothetical protein LBE18_01455 [Planctomycetaceae bacterium]|nr:hypothetical protein [Planctomycetaceae bacterium]
MRILHSTRINREIESIDLFRTIALDSLKSSKLLFWANNFDCTRFIVAKNNNPMVICNKYTEINPKNSKFFL